MKISLKYGLLIAVFVMAWVLIARATITNPGSIVHTLGTPIFVSIVQFVMIYLGVKEFGRQKGDKPTFKEGLKTGAGISLVYALAASLFFVGVLMVVGTSWLASEPGPRNISATETAVRAFVGLFVLAMIFGLIYSTVISFFLAKRRSEER